MPDISEQSIAGLAIDYWKLLNSLHRAASELPHERSTRFLAQARFSTARLEAHLENAGLRLVTFDGKCMSTEFPVTVVNADEAAGHESQVIENTIEPAVVAGARVVSPGRVIIRGKD
jgi:hypothetical protein